MISCANCIWFDKCSETREICDFYDPLNSEETQILEYEIELKERVEEYEQIIDEFNN